MEPALYELLERAIRLKNRRDFVGAAKVLLRTVQAFPNYGPAWGLLGGVYLFELGQPKKAIGAFRRASLLLPRSESASLGLFHSLWECGQRKRAIAEMERFRAVAHSGDYAEIACELKLKGVGR